MEQEQDDPHLPHAPKAADPSKPDNRTPGSYGAGGGEEGGKLWPTWPFVYCPPAGNGLYFFKWVEKKIERRVLFCQK